MNFFNFNLLNNFNSFQKIILLSAYLLTINIYSYKNSDINFALISFYIICWLGIFYEINSNKFNIVSNNNRYSLPYLIGIVLITLFSIKSILTNNLNDKFLFISILFSTIILNIFTYDSLNILKNKRIIIFGFMQSLHYFLMPFLTISLQIITSKISNFYLNLIGINSYQDYIFIVNKPNIIEVNTGCSGYDQIFFSITSFIILYQILPLNKKLNLSKLTLLSVFLPIFLNSLRIFLLSLFIFSKSSNGKLLFDFFHESYGSLIFSGFSVYFCGKYYLHLISNESKELNTKIK